MITYFGSQLSPNKVETAEGFLICRNVPIARIGEQTYLRRELQLDGDPEETVRVNRYDTDVFDKKALASFEGKPVTDGHPADSVGPENFSSLAKGHVQNVRREDPYIVGDLYINDASLISDIQNGVKREVSCGYLCDYVPDGEDYKQTKIRGNHVAVVQSGRAGHEVAIKDAAAEAEERTHTMSKFAKSVLTAFGVAAKDAKEDELKALADLASVALESGPAEKAPEDEPAKDEMVEKAPKGDDLGTKLDKVIAMLSDVLKNDTKDEEPEKSADEEEPTTDEDELQEAIDELEETAEESSEVIQDEDPTEEETVDCDISAGEAKDAAAFLRSIRPAVARISNKDERARVTKAILKNMKSRDGQWKSIFGATAKAAQSAADASGKTSYEKRCETQSNAYASRNPHTSKKEEK